MATPEQIREVVELAVETIKLYRDYASKQEKEIAELKAQLAARDAEDVLESEAIATLEAAIAENPLVTTGSVTEVGAPVEATPANDAAVKLATEAAEIVGADVPVEIQSAVDSTVDTATETPDEVAEKALEVVADIATSEVI